MDFLQLVAALMPILAVLVFLVVMRMPASVAMPLSLVLVASLAAFVWLVPPIQLAASMLEGWVIAMQILIIVFGAIVLLNTLKLSGAVNVIRTSFTAVSPDIRVQIVIAGWMFVSFLEGVSGFGTPAAIVAPLLLSLGFPAMAAVVVALAANSSATTFGAAGTPVLVGVTEGLDNSSADEIMQIAVNAVSLDVFIGSLIPLVLILMVTRFFGPNKSFKEGLGAWKFALLGGLSFTLPAWIVANTLGAEFPSIIGGLVGLVITITAAKNNFLTPKDYWTFADGCISKNDYDKKQGEFEETTPTQDLSVFIAWSPYVLVTLILISTRLEFLPFKDWLMAAKFSFPELLGTNVSASLAPLYLPGSVFMLVALITAALHQVKAKDVPRVWGISLKMMIPTVITLAAAVPSVRIFLNSGVNASGLTAMPLELAALAADIFGSNWPLAAPFVGALSTFVAGSTTFANMMFSQFQYSTAEAVNLSPQWIVALQMLGANAGNMIAVTNVVAVATLVNLIGKEGQIIRYTVMPMLFYVTSIGLLSWVYLSFLAS